eukprot:scaffold338_cov54-Phaeocystis_antarctica.AAC.2
MDPSKDPAWTSICLLTDSLSVSDDFLRFWVGLFFSDRVRSMRGPRPSDLPDLYDTHFSDTFRTSQSAISAIFG